MGKLIFSLQQHNPLLKMLFAALLVFFVATAAAAPSDIVVGYDLDDHEHTQKGQAGTAVTGSYSFTAADGVEHVVTYIADDKGYRVVGDATIESTPRPTTPRPTTARPTQPPTRPPTKAPVVKAPVAQVVQAVHAIPVQYVHAIPAQIGNFYHAGFSGACGGDGQEVVGADGARYILRKI